MDILCRIYLAVSLDRTRAISSNQGFLIAIRPYFFVFLCKGLDREESIWTGRERLETDR